jgi:hypothetical protein
MVRKFRKGLINDKLMPICKRCPSGDIIDLSITNKKPLFHDLTSWKRYLKRLYQALNDLPEVSVVLQSLQNTPIVFQYNITDRPEFNFWQAFGQDKLDWGLGENNAKCATKLLHTTDFNTLIKVNSGEINPIQATMDGIYVVDGDVTVLMSCAPVLPLTIKAHGIAHSIAEGKDEK